MLYKHIADILDYFLQLKTASHSLYKRSIQQIKFVILICFQNSGFHLLTT